MTNIPPIEPDRVASEARQTILTQVAEALGAPLPEACIPGVLTNVRLLNDHWTTLRAAGDISGRADA